MKRFSKKAASIIAIASMSFIGTAHSLEFFNQGVVLQYDVDVDGAGYVDLLRTSDSHEWYLIADWISSGAPANAVAITEYPGEITDPDGLSDGLSPLIIESGSPTNLLYLDSQARVGINTNVPASDLHVTGDGAGSVDLVLQLESTVPPQQVFRNSNTNSTWFFAMTADDQFKVSYDGTGRVEAKFFQNGNLTIAGALTQNSDISNKKNINDVNPKDVLNKVADLPISTWEYKNEEGVKHLGPMAQDFHSTFGLGSTPKGISSIDTGGVALAAIKGLHEIFTENDIELQGAIEEKDKKIAVLTSQMMDKDRAISDLVIQSERQDREIASLKSEHAELKSLLYELVSEKPVAMADQRID
jgi:hypothetical protein